MFLSFERNLIVYELSRLSCAGKHSGARGIGPEDPFRMTRGYFRVGPINVAAVLRTTFDFEVVQRYFHHLQTATEHIFRNSTRQKGADFNIFGLFQRTKIITAENQKFHLIFPRLTYSRGKSHFARRHRAGTGHYKF